MKEKKHMFYFSEIPSCVKFWSTIWNQRVKIACTKCKQDKEKQVSSAFYDQITLTSYCPNSDDVVKFLTGFKKNSTQSIHLPSFSFVWHEMVKMGGGGMF